MTSNEILEILKKGLDNKELKSLYANATEHMSEYISRFGKTSDSIGIRSQVMLESYSAALNVAMNSLAEKSPGRYFGMYGNWELGINTETGIVYHARMIY